jgi:integrase/recombinase XerC
MNTEHLMLQVCQPSPLRASLSAFLLDRQASRCTSKTLEHYQYTCGSFVEWLGVQGILDVGQITAHHIRAYLVRLQQRGLKDTTQHAHARGIKAWLNWLVREGDLDESPMRKVAMPRLEKRVPAPFKADDVKKLLACCDRKTPIGARNYSMVLSLLDTGLRAAEFVSLRIGGLDMRSGLATILGKGRKQRQVRVGSKARAAIVRMMGFRQRVADGEPLWIAYDVNRNESGALSIHGLQTMLHRLGRKVAVMPCSPHRFRRTFALWCLRDGMDLHN